MSCFVGVNIFETEKNTSNKGLCIFCYGCVFSGVDVSERIWRSTDVDAEQKPMRFCKGETLFLPAGLGRCLAVGDAELIKVRC